MSVGPFERSRDVLDEHGGAYDRWCAQYGVETERSRMKRRITELEAAIAAAAARGEERMRERAAAYIEADGFDNTVHMDFDRDKSPHDWFNRQRAAGIRALPLSTPEKQTEAAPASNGEAG